MDEPGVVRAVIRRALVMLALGALLAAARAVVPERPALAVVDADSVLIDQAERRGWHRTDPVVRQRLVDDQRLVGWTGDDATLVDQGVALELHRRDPVARARLLGRARAALRALDREASTVELEAWRTTHAARFARPGRVRLRFVSTPPPVVGREVEADAGRLDRLLGAGFGTEVTRLGVGRHTVASAYGAHEVEVLAAVPVTAPPLGAIRAEVAEDWAEARRDALASERLRALIGRYKEAP